MRDDRPSGASDTWRSSQEQPAARERPAPAPVEREPWEPEVWVRVDEVRDEATGAVRRARTEPPKPGSKALDRQRLTGDAPANEGSSRARLRGVNREVADEITRVAGSISGPKLTQRLADASRAYERERYEEARKILRPLSERAPGAASVRELYGLTLYRMGLWKQAIKELEVFKDLTGSCEQHPVLADCYRALGRMTDVQELWEELREDSPSAELVAEGRIVMAGAYADRGDLPGAKSMLEAGLKNAKRLGEHHLRMLYALADVQERLGDVPQARATFQRIAAIDATFADVTFRLRSLG